MVRRLCETGATFETVHYLGITPIVYTDPWSWGRPEWQYSMSGFVVQSLHIGEPANTHSEIFTVKVESTRATFWRPTTYEGNLIHPEVVCYGSDSTWKAVLAASSPKSSYSSTRYRPGT